MLCIVRELGADVNKPRMGRRHTFASRGDDGQLGYGAMPRGESRSAQIFARGVDESHLAATARKAIYMIAMHGKDFSADIDKPKYDEPTQLMIAVSEAHSGHISLEVQRQSPTFGAFLWDRSKHFSCLEHQPRDGVQRQDTYRNADYSGAEPRVRWMS
jgi:hypothetical protein